LWVRIEYDDVDEIRLEINDADKTFLNINNSAEPFLLSKKNMNTNVEDSDEITITCLGELTENKTITAYAYPKGCLAKPKEEQEEEKIVAGQLLVCKNNDIKESKIVLVRVISAATGERGRTGVIEAKEIELLRSFLYQALIFPTIQIESNTDAGQPIILDLSKDRRFLTKEAARTLAENDARNAGAGAAAITAAGDAAENDPNTAKHIIGAQIDFNIRTLHSSGRKYKIQDMMQDIKQKFMNEPENSFYRECFPIFALDEEASFGAVTEATGVKNVILAKRERRADAALVHEVYHGFGLEHTHDDKPPANPADPPSVIKQGNRNQKYIFPAAPAAGSTANIMSYNLNKYKSTWKWQWEIARQNV